MGFFSNCQLPWIYLTQTIQAGKAVGNLAESVPHFSELYCKKHTINKNEERLDLDASTKARQLTVFCIIFASKCSHFPAKSKYLKASKLHSCRQILISNSEETKFKTHNL